MGDKQKAALTLIRDIRVMTLAVSDRGMPWSSPVYFVFHDSLFCFFSNRESRHIRVARDGKTVAASIFHDADSLDRIFGFQMTGTLKQITDARTHLAIVKAYVAKFDFLRQAFGPRVLENPRFFLEKFKSSLFGFVPEKIYFSDNASPDGNRSEFDLNALS